MTPEEMKQELGRLFAEFKKDNDAQLAEVAKKGHADPLLVEKLAKMEKGFDKFEELNQRLTKAELERKAAHEDLEAKLNRTRFGAGGAPDPKGGESKAAFFSFARKGREGLSADESKALTLSDDTAGGVLAPVEYVKEIIKAVVLVSPVRDLVRIRNTSQRTVQVPKRTSPSAATWVGENQTRTEGTNPAYGLVEIPTHEMTAEVYVSFAELEDSAFDIEAELRAEFAEQFAVTEGAAVIKGNGVNKPQGCIDASAGLATTNSGSAATIADSTGQGNGIINLAHAVKSAYARNGVWCLNRQTLGAVRKLQDTQKRYLWEPGVANGMPNTILGSPYCECPDMPDEGANATPISFGDMRQCYTLVDRLAISVLRDPYTKAGAGQVKFLARRRIGGQVVLAEACRLLKCAA